MVHVYVESKEGLLKKYPLKNGLYNIGSSEAEIILNFPTVSKKHALIQIQEQAVTLQDLGSHNGTFLIRKKIFEPINPNQQTPWQKTEKISVGPFVLWWNWNEKTQETASFQERYKFYGKLYSRLLLEKPQLAKEHLLVHLKECPEYQENILEEIHHEFHGNGPVREFFNNPQCKEILVNDYDQIYIDLGNGLQKQPSSFLSHATYQAWVLRLVHQAARRLDLQNPICEATLENGSRFHAVLSPISAHGICVAIRKFGSAPITEQDGIQTKWLDQKALNILKDAVFTKKNIVISGGTSTGKTSLLNFLCQYLNASERVITIEDTLELSPPIENLVQLQARKANADGAGEVPLRTLVQCALRMRPDRIIVGECRGAEVLEMLQALNTGHPGSLTTVHANSTKEAMHRLELLTLLGAPNLSLESIRQWISASVDLIIQVERDAAGHRHVLEIAGHVAQDTSERKLNVLYKRSSDK